MPALSPGMLGALVPDWKAWPVFFETGTYHGETVLAMEPYFDELHTVELSEELWRHAMQRYPGKKIRFHHGDSVTALARHLPLQQQPAIFFLDSHWSCGGTARGKIEVPLLEELEKICGEFQPPAVIIVDDLRLFGEGPHSGEPVNWTSISHAAIGEIVGSRCISWAEHRTCDKLVLRLKPQAMAPIPPSLHVFPGE